MDSDDNDHVEWDPSWILQQATSLREEYQNHCNVFLVDPHSQGDDAPDPLSLSDDSPWHEYFANQALSAEIQQDVLRTYPEHPFFRGEVVQHMLHRILLVYARLVPALAYRQGMHELLAPLILQCSRNALSAQDIAHVDSALKPPFVSFAPLCDPKWIEADAFIAFSRLMRHMRPMFVPSTRNGPNLIVQRCERIQSSLLRSKDPELCAYLESIDVAPQLYMLRWLRCLFGREFHLDDTMRLWDALFCFGPRPLVLVDYFCLAMMRYVRSQLLEGDNAACLTRLKHFPPVEDIDNLILLATKMQRGEAIPLLSSGSTVVADPVREPTRTVVDAGRDPLSADSTVDAVPNDREYLAERINRVCHSLQTEMTQTPVIAENEAILFALAELKHVRDVLAGRFD